MIAVLHNRDFALLWVGGLISLSGNWILLVGLPLSVFELTGSTAAISVTLIASWTPRVLFASLGGVIVDRVDRRLALLVTNLMLAAALLPLAAVRSSADLWIVLVVVAVSSSLTQVSVPAETALLPRVVGEDRLVAANALNSLNNQFARLLGSALGGLIVAGYGLVGVVIADAASFLAAAALVGAVSVDGRPLANADATRPSRRGLWSEWWDGVRLIRRLGRPVAALFFFAGIAGLGEGVMATLLVPFAREVLDGGPALYGALMSAQAVGGLAGGLLVGGLSHRVEPLRLLALSSLLLGGIDLLIFTYPLVLPGSAIALGLMAIVGVPAIALLVSLTTLQQTVAPDAYRGRVLGAGATTFALAILAGTAIAGTLGEVTSVILLLCIPAAAYMVAGAGLLAFERDLARSA